MAEILWKDRRRTLFGLPWSFTRYSYSKEKLYIKTGFFNIKEEEVRLYRILDVTLSRKLGERIFGLGTIHCCSADKSTPEFDIKRIKKSEAVKEQLSDLIEAQRVEKRISGREFMSDDDEHDGAHDDIL